MIPAMVRNRQMMTMGRSRRRGSIFLISYTPLDSSNVRSLSTLTETLFFISNDGIITFFIAGLTFLLFVDFGWGTFFMKLDPPKTVQSAFEHSRNSGLRSLSGLPSVFFHALAGPSLRFVSDCLAVRPALASAFD
uniref:(northern house mosquito) hypothetical protein n=1 Tax=Culex pipiens TaxID=7175 RepID=A0A8D8MKW0_CULPI